MRQWLPHWSLGPLCLALALALALWLAPVGQAAAQDDAALTLTARAGFDGFFKEGAWVPVQVTAANDGPPLGGTLRVTVGSATSGDEVVYTAPISLPTRSNKRVTLYISLPRLLGAPVVELRDDDGRLVASVAANTLNQLARSALLYGVVSPDPGELEFLENVDGGRGRAAVAFLDMAELPEVTAAWRGLDVLIFNDVDTARLTPPQQAALRHWVAAGGQLVVAGGPGWQKTSAGLADLLPVTLNGSDTRDDLPALRAAAGLPFRDPGPYLLAASSLQQGQLLLHEAGLPLLARRDLDAGQVYFLALDPGLAPLVDWDGSEAVWALVADAAPVPPYWSGGFQNSYAAGTAVTSLPSLALPSVLTLVLFLLFYVLIIGPGNYLVLKRLGRRELAWGTVPALVLLFSGVAYFTGFQLKGNDVILNQMSLVNGQVGSDSGYAQSLLGLYSPRRGRYDVHLPADALVRPFERSFGQIGGSGNLDAVRRGADLTLQNVRVDVSAMETFVVDSVAPLPALQGQAELRLENNIIMLEATVKNVSDLTLTDVTLLLGDRTFALGDLPPGVAQSTSSRVGAAGSLSGIQPPGSSAPGAPAVPGPPATSPLTSNAGAILGSTNYYDDPELYPRWQMLEAIDGRGFGGAALGASPTNVVTVVAWSDLPQVAATLERDEYRTPATTLYLLSLPLTQQIVSGTDVALPLAMLDWEVLDADNVYEAAVQGLVLNDGAVEFEFTPWPEFQAMDVSRLAVALLPAEATAGRQPPDVYLWHWDDERWLQQADAGWGETPVTGAAAFLGPANAVRLRLATSEFGLEIAEVYPVLTGDIR